MSLIQNLLHATTKRFVVEDQEGAQKALTLALIIVRVALNALCQFQAKDFRQFDALVGEAQCQIRAVKVLQLAKKGLQLDAKINQLRSLHLQIMNSFDQYVHEPLPLVKYLSNFDQKLDKDDLFLVLCHLLFFTRGLQDPSQTIPENLIQILENDLQTVVDRQMVTDLVFRCKEELAKMSVEIIQDEASSNPLETRKIRKALVTKDNVLCKYNLPRVSCYMGLKILIDGILARGDQILMVCEDQSFLLTPHEDFFLVSDPRTEPNNEPVIVIEAEYDGIPTADFKHLMLQDAANHYQFFSRDDVGIPLFEKLKLDQHVQGEQILNLGVLKDRVKKVASQLYKNLNDIVLEFLQMERDRTAPTTLFRIRHIYTRMLRV